jgi:replicative DNA helicase
LPRAERILPDEKLPESTQKLPFDPAKQCAILGHTLRDKTFFLTCRTKILPEWFLDTRHGKVWKAALDFYTEFGRPPSRQELKGWRTLLTQENDVKGALQTVIDVCWVKSDEFGLDYLRTQLTEWYHAREYRVGVVESNRLYDSGEFKKSFDFIGQQVDIIRTQTFDEQTDLSFADPIFTKDDGELAGYLVESDRSYKNGLTTGLGILDAALTPDGSENPALYPGDTTVLLAPSNVGKTTALITMLRHNVQRQEPTLYLTHEGRPQDIREKVLCAILGKTKPELFALYKTGGGAATIRRMTEILGKYLTYIPFNRPGMTVEEVSALIRRRQQERVARFGTGYRLLVDDYPAKLTTDNAKNKGLAQRNLDAHVYDYFVQLALENNWHSLLAVQTNRSASKDNREENRLLTMEDVRESWDVMTMATNVISINRNVESAQQNRVTFYVCKSRSSEVGRAIVARSNYAASLSHSPGMGGCWYRSDSALLDQVEHFLRIRNGQEVTQKDIHEASEPAVPQQTSPAPAAVAVPA